MFLASTVVDLGVPAPIFITGALIAALGPTVTVIAGKIWDRRDLKVKAKLEEEKEKKRVEAERQAKADQALAQIATEDARRDAATAQRQAAEAISIAIKAGQETSNKLVDLQKTADATKDIASGTHDIVNSDATKMKRSLASALVLIAKLLPNDKEAQLTAAAAVADAEKSEANAALLAKKREINS